MNADEAFSTLDRAGLPYGKRLARIRESIGLSAHLLADRLGMTLQEYEEWETFEGELNVATTLAELGKLSSALGVPSSLLFEDNNAGTIPVSPAELGACIQKHLEKTAMSLDDFESKIGFFVGQVLSDPTRVNDWNLDCLRSVCKEIGTDWKSVLMAMDESGTKR